MKSSSSIADQTPSTQLQVRSLQDSIPTPILAGLIGGVMASLIGRDKTRVDNMLVGAIFTGLAAYRDPRANGDTTIAIAAMEGAAWGIADQVIPKVKDMFSPSSEHVTATSGK